MLWAHLAGCERIELSSALLERAVLPLHQQPKTKNRTFLSVRFHLLSQKILIYEFTTNAKPNRTSVSGDTNILYKVCFSFACSFFTPFYLNLKYKRKFCLLVFSAKIFRTWMLLNCLLRIDHSNNPAVAFRFTLLAGCIISPFQIFKRNSRCRLAFMLPAI